MEQRYKIGEKIGKGGAGLVFRGYDTFLHRNVAVKRVLDTKDMPEDEAKEATRGLLKEAQTLSALSHPNIVTVFDVGIDKDGGYVVMEWLEGETLSATVERSVMTQEDFVELAVQSMDALIAAHAMNVTHRDLKPTNVMVNWQPSGRFQTKILDFGLAKFSKKPSIQTMGKDGTVLGTALFMAPEQFERKALDVRTDLYSMGCAYYYSLTGSYPFDGETPADVMDSHLEHRVTPLEIMRPDLAPSLSQWVMWLINRYADNRPKDARAALALLPKHPETAVEHEVRDIPVEESGKVKVIPLHPVAKPVKGANIPTDFVTVPGTSTTLLTRGASTTQLKKGQLLHDQQRKKSKKNAILGLVAAAAAIAVYFVITGMMAHHKNTYLNMISIQNDIYSSPETLDVMFHFLYSNKASPQQKEKARDALTKMKGEQVNNTLLQEIKYEAPNSDARLTLWRIVGDRREEDAVPDLLEAVRKTKDRAERKEILILTKGIVLDAQTTKGRPDENGQLPNEEARAAILDLYLEKIITMGRSL